MQTHGDAAQQLRVRIRQHADEQAEAGGGGAEKAAQEMEKDVLRELHRAERGKLQAQQAEAADSQARDAIRQQRADALAEAAEAADAELRRQPDQGIEAPGGGAEAQLQEAGAGA